MIQLTGRLLLLLATLLTPGCATNSTTPPPLPHLDRAHSHNDYTRPRPLLDAIDLGFASVEADVFLVDGQLLVAHDRKDCSPERTLDALYLVPLAERARANSGRIYPGAGAPFTLLIDIKADGPAAYTAIEERLRAFPDVFTEYDRGIVFLRAVTVIISGSTPREIMAAQQRRFAFVDGRLPDLEGAGAPTGLVPLISAPWISRFTWDGRAEMPADQRKELDELVAATHARGQRLRFWGIPNLPSVWRELHAAGVDLINADDLAGLAKVLREAQSTR